MCSGGIHDSCNRPSLQQLPEPAGVHPVGLRAALATPQRGRLDRLGEMRDRAAALQRAGDEQPAGTRPDRDVHHPAGEPPDPLLDRVRSRVDPPAQQLAGRSVHRVEGELPSMHVEPSHDHAGAHAHLERDARRDAGSVQHDRCHTVTHGRCLLLRRARVPAARAINQVVRRGGTDHMLPSPPRRHRPFMAFLGKAGAGACSMLANVGIVSRAG